MSTGALLFLIASWSLVLGLAGWAFYRILHQPDALRDGGAPDAADRQPPPG